MSIPPRRLRCLLLVALLAGTVWPWAGAAAEQQAEVLYSLEIDRDRLPPDEASAPDAHALAAALTGATVVRTYVFEPIAAVPTPRLVVALVTVTADGRSMERRELVFADDYLPPGIDLAALADAVDGKAALVELLTSLGADGLRVLDLMALGFAGADEREQAAVADAARVLRQASSRRTDRADHADRTLAALLIAAIPRTVETFDAGAGEGGAYVMLLDAGPAPGP